jgi:C4-dicarboxylate transporter DctM subunit
VIGMATPPVGILLFIVCAASGQSLTAVSKEATPLLGICLLVLILVAAIPAVTLLLPQAMMPVN